ncbi:hypothetical protein BH20ACT5_BH20ACT5_22670 [soil metagenome]
MAAGTRWVRLEGAVNVRDVGGLATADGGTTAPGRLLRADNLQDLTPTDVRRLVDEHGLRQVIDLRTGVEVVAEGPGPMHAAPEVDIEHLSLFPEAGRTTDSAAADVLPWHSDGRRDELAEMSAAERSAAYYLGYLRDRPDNIVAALRVIAARREGATLVHCAAGKDRTGVVVALALTVAGVDRDAIVSDYVATAEVLEPLVARLRKSPTYAADTAGRPLDSHRPRPETLYRLLDTLDAECGSPEGWLVRHGFGGTDQIALRRRLTA